jgi:hypothetical protein
MYAASLPVDPGRLDRDKRRVLQCYVLQEAGAWTMMASNSRHQTIDSRQQMEDSRRQTADCRHQIADSRQQTADSRRQTAQITQHISGSRSQTADFFFVDSRGEGK